MLSELIRSQFLLCSATTPNLQTFVPIIILSMNLNFSSGLEPLVLYTKGWVCDVALIGCTLSPGKSKRGWDFGREGTRGQWGTKGVSLRATWDWSGRFLSQLEGAK
jgi:hypothetical protein